jgi:hypothetical protein
MFNLNKKSLCAKNKGRELSHNKGQLKIMAEDGKMRETDVADTE